MNRLPPVITVDGPSGVGKGTLSQWLSVQWGWHWLDSGSLYRLTALSAQRRAVPLTDEHGVAEIAATLDVQFVTATAITLDGEEVSAQIRTETCGGAASQIAALPAVRTALLQRQRDFRRTPGLIADGRDMGTVVFPDAPLKLFLTADPATRAARRHQQLSEQGVCASLQTILYEIAARDARDSGRAIAPLQPAHDAHVVDTTALTITEVCAQAFTLATSVLRLATDTFHAR